MISWRNNKSLKFIKIALVAPFTPKRSEKMTVGWVKSMQCKSRAYEDVYRTTNCRDSYKNLKDVVNVDHSKPKPKSGPIFRPDSITKPKSKCKTTDRVRRMVSAPIAKGLDLDPVGVSPFYPAVTELAKGHPSRNVVEIIFHTRWGPRGFPGRVETVFKVQGPARGPARFEEYRELVRARAGPGSGSRCMADGNEMMRFHCLGCTKMDGCDGGVLARVVCTYSGSGVAHESAGSGTGRRVMVVCRVIAGRVLNRIGLVDPVSDNKSGVSGDFDSLSGKNGELLVFDPRAILPCFLVIYKL
ncbi:uncharacterized protein LOC141585792 [Silene latifolia]|uniref:uncharacterized protein LOC141585792 n=1 Tax=Silene latifolia TaxID=37657 RepID=UPI003D77F4A8